MPVQTNHSIDSFHFRHHKALLRTERQWQKADPTCPVTKLFNGTNIEIVAPRVLTRLEYTRPVGLRNMETRQTNGDCTAPRLFSDDAVFRIAGSAGMLTPALLIDRNRVQHNIAGTLRLLSDNANRWRPHVKTAKLGYVMRMLVDAGVRQFKCSTSLELSVACQAGALDVLVAYPLIGANAARVRQIAEQHPSVAISALVENESQVAQWRGTSVGLFVDVNPG